MSSHTNAPLSPFAKARDIHVGIVRTLWNSDITQALLDGAVSELTAQGLTDQDFEIYEVPGAVELTFAASQLIEAGAFDAVIVLGCVIRGGTPHFDYVCQSVTQGITALNADCDIPVIFGVLTVDNEKDAIDRIDGTVGDKGAECAGAALKMIAFRRHVQEL